MSKLIKSAEQMVEEARNEIVEVSAAEAIERAKDENCLIVDLRDVRERWREGYIPGSFHCPRGMTEFWIDPESPYFKPVFAEDKTFIFHCAIGHRSALTVQTINRMGFKNAAHIAGGFSAWKDAGGPVQIDDKK